MSGRVCYLARADRGDRPAQVRLVGAGSDQAWSQFGATDAPGVRREIEEAAGWVAERASRGDGPRGEIEVLVVDVEGSACAWVTSPSPDAVVIGAALSGEVDDWSRGLERAESSVQALAPARARASRGRRAKRGGGGGGEDGARKLAVLMIPDVPARLLVDSLDERGVSVERVVSLWQAASLAWDPSGPAGSGEVVRGERVVASSAPVSAVVVIDPAGRLVWSWSREGELVAGGTLRLSTDRREGAAGAVRVGNPEVARLTTDWISWSVQLGEAPARVLCLGPDGSGEEGSLDPAALGAALTRAWPGATVDLVVHDDPIGATLGRLARAEGAGAEESEGRTTLVELSRRPGKSHRAMFRWSAVAVLALSLGLIGVGGRAWRAGEKARTRASAAEAKVKEVVRQTLQPKNQVEEETAAAAPRKFLEQKIAEKRLALNPTGGLEPAKPILPELETLSYVLGMEGVEIDEIQLLPTNAIFYVMVPDTQTFEAIDQALRSIGGSHVTWQGNPSADVGGKKRYMFQGTWKRAAPGPGGAGAPARGAP